MKRRRQYPLLLRALLAVVVVALAVAGVGCASPQGQDAGAKAPLQVAATIFPLYDFAKRIAGERAAVTLLVPPGADVHLWEPGVDTLRALGQVDLIVYNGLGLEPWLAKVAGAADNAKLRLVDASAGLPLGATPASGSAQAGAGEGAGAQDPHVWLDPVLAKGQAANIRDALIAVDPAGKDYYIARYDCLARRLDRLDYLFRTVLAGAKQKEFVVSHAAFGYLASRYGLRQIALTGPEGEAEASPSQLAAVAELFKRGQQRFLFADANHARRVAAALAQEVGAQVLVLHHLAAPGPEQVAAGEDYFSLMEENLVNLSRGLE